MDDNLLDRENRQRSEILASKMGRLKDVSKCWTHCLLLLVMV